MLKVLGRFAGGMAMVAATVGAGAGLALLPIGAQGAGAAASFTVTDMTDGPVDATNCITPVPDACTLRDAVQAADTAGTNATITLPSLGAGDVYNVDSANGGTLDIGGGNIVTILGGGQADTVIQATCSPPVCSVDFGVLEIDSDTTADISGVTVEDGNAADGGGIDNTGTLTLADSTVTNNTANDGGGVYVLNATTNTFTNDTISGNTAADDAGGGVYLDDGTNTFTGGSITDNTANDDGEGGGVFINGGTNSFSGGTVTGNTGTNDQGEGGGFFVDGGINTFTDETVNQNTVDGDGDGGGFYVNDGTNTFTDVTVNDNTSNGEGGGGGIWFDGGSNTFTGGSIHGNTAFEGAGALLDSGTESLSQVDISANTAGEAGGGLWIEVEDVTEPTTITSSTISGNDATGLLGNAFNGAGGGIIAVGCNQIALTNDTITGNSSLTFGGGYDGVACSLAGGPIQPAALPAHVKADAQQPHVIVGATTAFLFDTITGNTSTDGDGGNIAQQDSSTITLGESIVAGGIADSDPQNCALDGSAPGSFTSAGYNVIDDNTCGAAGPGDVIGQDPQLGALGNNGGPTQTELPASTSPAVSNVPAAVCSGTGVATDQRGEPRGSGTNGACTSGAVEVAVPQTFNPNGYRLVADEGGIFDFGLNFDGSLANNHLNAPIVGLANSPGVNGYLMVGSDGGVFALGGANFFGSLGGQAIPSPIAAIAAPPNEAGYWLVAQNGKVYNYGAVPALPALPAGSPPAGAHIVGMASTTDGQGAWLTDNFGDVYALGSAQYVGGLGGIHINKPIVGIAAAASGQGYALVATDGGVFAFGTQQFFGSVPGSLKPGQSLNAPIVGIAVTHSGNGYWEVGADGGVFTYGDAPFLGSMAGVRLNGPVVGIQHLGSAPPG